MLIGCMCGRRAARLWTIAMAAAAGSVALGQPAPTEHVPEPPERPAQAAPAPPQGTERATPAGERPVQPIGNADDSAVHKPELIREGAFLSRAQGEMRRLSSGRWAFVFNPDLSGRTLPPMILLPCMNLAAMEQIVSLRSEPIAFAVSGQVFVYHNANYLLPLAHATVSAQDGDAAGGQDDGRASGPPRPTGARPDPTVDDLIRALDEATPARHEAPAPQRASGAAPGLLREGSMLTLRRGRVTRGGGGELVFTIDSGVDQPGAADAPATLMPCESVEAIERLLRERDASLAFVVSGRVFVYGGRNYLLPTMYEVALSPGGNLTSGQ